MQASGLCRVCASARSNSGLYSMTRLDSTPQEALTISFGVASSMRLASSLAAKPPNTTECMTPNRAQASIAITASGTMGM
jgi:hypothetical protein